MKSATCTVSSSSRVPLGSPFPATTVHATTVSLPTWEDVAGYASGESRVLNAISSNYPRGYIHPSIQKLARRCEIQFARDHERAFLLPTEGAAKALRAFIDIANHTGRNAIAIRLVSCRVKTSDYVTSPCFQVALIPPEGLELATQFWKHTGVGISSRFAEHALRSIPENEDTPSNNLPTVKGFPVKEYINCDSRAPTTSLSSSSHYLVTSEDHVSSFVKSDAKHLIRCRIASLVSVDTRVVKEDDVFLYPTGMAAIWHAHNLVLNTRPPAKSVCFGFPYGDTLSVLRKWGPGCHFVGGMLDSDMLELERLLERESLDNAGKPVLAVFTEFPSNPLLQSADLQRLRTLADMYDFLIIVDDSIGNFVNIDVLPWADILVSSLSKIFSGKSDVNGGSMVLNPASRHYDILKAYMQDHFDDMLFEEDASKLEKNSRDVVQRVNTINASTETICDFLRTRSSPVIHDICYPKFVTPSRYAEVCRKPHVNGQPRAGFGTLFSLKFTSVRAAQVFYDNLAIFKGPSFGTDFSLCIAYTVLVHDQELDWAAQFGVTEGLVRIGIGLEDVSQLMSIFEVAVDTAERAALTK